METKHPVTSFEAWRWPEFRAFAERLGIDIDGQRIEDLTIEFKLDDLVRVMIKRQCVELNEPTGVIDVTTADNAEHRTFITPPKAKPFDGSY